MGGLHGKVVFADRVRETVAEDLFAAVFETFSPPCDQQRVEVVHQAEGGLFEATAYSVGAAEISYSLLRRVSIFFIIPKTGRYLLHTDTSGTPLKYSRTKVVQLEDYLLESTLVESNPERISMFF